MGLGELRLQGASARGRPASPQPDGWRRRRVLPARLANVLAKRLANLNGQRLTTSCWTANWPIRRRPTRPRASFTDNGALPAAAQVDDIVKRLRLGRRR